MADWIDLVDKKKLICNIHQILDKHINASADYPTELFEIKRELLGSIEIEQSFFTQDSVNRWIPVEDALPEIKKDHESDCVLCYCDTGAYAFSTLQENFFGQIGFACEKEDDYYHSIGKVIAWMYLPEPPEKE